MSRYDRSQKESRKRILWDLIVFQVKLWLEGFKDFVLMPLSLAAAIIDFVFGSLYGRGALYAVMRLGDRFERWVRLYAALEATESADTGRDSSSASLEDPSNEDVDGIEERVPNGGSERTDRSDSNP